MLCHISSDMSQIYSLVFLFGYITLIDCVNKNATNSNFEYETTELNKTQVNSTKLRNGMLIAEQLPVLINKKFSSVTYDTRINGGIKGSRGQSGSRFYGQRGDRRSFVTGDGNIDIERRTTIEERRKLNEKDGFYGNVDTRRYDDRIVDDRRSYDRRLDDVDIRTVPERRLSEEDEEILQREKDEESYFEQKMNENDDENILFPPKRTSFVSNISNRTTVGAVSGLGTVYSSIGNRNIGGVSVIESGNRNIEDIGSDRRTFIDETGSRRRVDINNGNTFITTNGIKGGKRRLNRKSGFRETKPRNSRIQDGSYRSGDGPIIDDGLDGRRTSFGGRRRLDDRPDFLDSEADTLSLFGNPGVDFPVYSTLPRSDFSCNNRLPGYYADAIGSSCQAFYICQSDGRKDGFLCPNATIFNQEKFVCDWWYNVDCARAESFYELNANLYQGPSIGIYGTANDLPRPTVNRARPSSSFPARGLDEDY